MTSVDERTKFCASCKHRVIDFTKATNEEFEAAKNSGQRICGRFNKSQMNLSFLQYAAATALISATTIACSPAQEVIQPKELLAEEEILIDDIPLMGIVIVVEDSVYHKPDRIR